MTERLRITASTERSKHKEAVVPPHVTPRLCIHPILLSLSTKWPIVAEWAAHTQPNTLGPIAASHPPLYPASP